ncbi:GMC family oxidoreductase [Hwanghaeella sp.]|uniref:GMC family oxidoreductase n=1 Tax=Hwanghaeella sp. TaxID=2605943 RepID=UPI003CCBA2BF
MDRFDYVIVGAGSAGCVLANRLSEDGKHTVCLLEAGPPDWNPYIHIPTGFMKLMDHKTLNWRYETEPSEWTGGRAIPVPRGKTLGGSSSINGNVYTRGNREDYNTWAQFGNRGWGYADVLPYFKRAETKLNGDGTAFRGEETFRGDKGPLVVTDTDWKHELCDAFIEGCVSQGIPKTDDYNGRHQEGVSYTQRTIHKRRRMSTARAFLKPAKSRPNLTVITEAHATGLILEGRKVMGVRYSKGGRGGSPREVGANREVILSGGVINSPQLMLLSGIGDPKHLDEMGIPLAHALPSVGMNLRDHYAPRFSAKVKNVRTFNQDAQGIGLIPQVARWVLGKPGVLSVPATQVYAFWRSDPKVANSDVQLTFAPASYAMGRQATLDKFPGMSIATWQQRPDSSGYVKLKSADPFDKPIIQPNYLEEESDRRVLLAGMKLARRVMHSEPMAPYFQEELFPGRDVVSDDELLESVKGRGTTTFHPAGTCRMGPAENKTTVVDDHLRVHGLEGLRVVDASIMPMMVSANLNAGVIMIAEKASDLILGKPAPEAIVVAD